MSRESSSGFNPRSPIESLDHKKRGRPLIGRRTRRPSKSVHKMLKRNGAVINATIVTAVAEGIVRSYGSNLLKANGGHIYYKKNWAKSMLSWLGYVKRRVSATMKVMPKTFEACKSQFVFYVQSIRS